MRSAIKNILSTILKIILCFCGTMLILTGIGGIVLCFCAKNSFTVIFCIVFVILFFAVGIVLFYIALRKAQPSKHSVKETLAPSANQLISKVDMPVPPKKSAEKISDSYNETNNIVCNTGEKPTFNNEIPSKTLTESSTDNKCVPLTNDDEIPIHAPDLEMPLSPEDSQHSSNAIETKDSIPSATQYVETDSGIYRADKKSIGDEEVSYLMQIGYEEALQKEGLYRGQPLDLSLMQERDKNKKEYTKIPTYDELSILEPSEVSLCSTDIFFLKYINGLPLKSPFIAQYWYYDYNLNYSEEIKKLVSAGLLTISNVNISKFKVADLKKILKDFHLPLTGKKHDLQERILSNIPVDTLSDYLGNDVKYFCTTKKGEGLINNIHESATKNLELENSCIDSILNYDFDAALSMIRNFRFATPSGSSPSVSNCSSEIYNNIMRNSPFFYTLVKDRDIEQKVRAGIVFCRMYGSSQDNTLKLIHRIYTENGKDFDEDARNILSGRLL